jgi:hypothetical protein
MTKEPKAAAETPEPNTYAPPTVTIAGTTYPMRRLGLEDVFTVSRILGSGVAELGAAKGTKGAQGAAFIQVIVAAIAQNQEPVLRLFASIIGVERADLKDPDRFPMDSIITLGEAMAEHQDLMGFLAAVNRLGARTPEMQTRSGASSTS